MATLAAVDLGAQSGRVAVGRFDGERLEVEEVHRFANVPVQVRETLQWDVLALWRETVDGLRAAARDRRLDAVAVDSWAVDFGLLDRAGRLVRNPVHYRDRRRAAAVERVLERVPARELYERTGIQLLPINTLFELAAMAAEPDPALAEAETLLLVPDLVGYWLCGSRTTERTNASTTQCLDPRSGAWAADLLQRLDVPPRLLPEIVEPGTRLGTTAPDVGLEGVAVVAGATHDTGAAVAAIPLGERTAYLSVGTWSLVGVESDEPVITDASFAANLTNESGVEGTFRVLRNVTGLWLLHECRRAWGGTETFEQLVALAQDAPPLRSLVDPDDPSFAEPGDMPARIAAACERSGQPAPEGVAATVRCILESLALKHAVAVDAVAEATGREIAELHVVGGGARNEPLCRWTAAAAQRPVHAGPAEATLIGNLLVQLLALGELDSLAEGREVVRRSFAPVEIEPEGGEEWREAVERFDALVHAGAAS